MIKWNELRRGSLILFDHKVGRQPPSIIMRGIVESADQKGIIFKGQFERSPDVCAGIVIDKSWFESFAVATEDLQEVMKLQYVHQLQNYLSDKYGRIYDGVMYIQNDHKKENTRHYP